KMNIIEGCKVHDGAMRSTEEKPESEMGRLRVLIGEDTENRTQANPGRIPRVSDYFLRDGLVVKEPRSETGVWPFFYRFLPPGTKRHAVVHASIRKVIEQHCTGEDILKYAEYIGNAEIDLLIEDNEWFMFLEAKLKPSFTQSTPLNIHQLVRQHVQGKLLEKIERKHFIHGTVGVGKFQFEPNEHDKVMLNMVGSSPGDIQEIMDCPWSLLEA